MAGSKMSSAASLADRKVVSVSTNLGTKIVLVATLSDSFGTMRATIETHHSEIFPQWGPVSITAVEAELWNGRHHIHDDFGVTVLFLVTNPSLYVEMTSPIANIPPKPPMLNPADAIGQNSVPELELVKAPASPRTHPGRGERLRIEGEAAVPGNLEVGFVRNSTVVETCDGGTSDRCGSERSDAVDRHARKKKKKLEEQLNGFVDSGTSKKKKHRVEDGVNVRGEDEASNVRKISVEEQANRAVEVETSKKKEKKKKHKVEERVDGAGEDEIYHKKQKVEEAVNGATEVETSTKKHKVKKQLNGAGEGEPSKKKKHKAGKRMDRAGQVEIANPAAAKEAVEVVEKQSGIGGSPAVSEEKRPHERVVGIAKPSTEAETVGLRKESSVSAMPNGESQTGKEVIEKVCDGPDVVGLQLIGDSTVAKSSQAGVEGHGAATSDDYESRQPLGFPVVDTVDRYSNLETSVDRVQLKSLQSVKAWHESSSSDGSRCRSLSVPEKMGDESSMLNAINLHARSSLGVGTSGKSRSTNTLGSRGQSVYPVAEMLDSRPLMVTLMTDVGGRGSLALDHVHASSSTDNCSNSSESGSPTDYMKKRNRGGEQATKVVLSVMQDGKNLQSSSLHNPKVLSRRDPKRRDRHLSSGTTTDGTSGDSSEQSEDFGKKSPLKLQSKNDNRKVGASSPEDVSKSHNPEKMSGEKDVRKKITTAGSAVSSDESASDDRTSASEAISDDTELHNRVSSRKVDGDGDGDGAVRSNIRRSSGEFVHRKYQHLIDSQDGFDELISLSQQKLKVGPASTHDLHPVDEVRNSEELVSLADDNLATNLVPDNEADLGHQDLVEHIISQDKVEANMEIASKSAVQNELNVVEPLKIREENGKDRNDLPGSAKDGDLDRLLTVKAEPIIEGASIPTGEGPATMSDDSQQLRAAVQLARMSMSESGSQKPPEKSPIRKNKSTQQERSILQDHVLKRMDAVLDVAPVDLRPQDSQLIDTEKHTKSSVKDLSVDDQNLDINCLSSPNLVVDISPEHAGVMQATDLILSKQDEATTDKNCILEETAVDAPDVKKASTKKKKFSKQSPLENESDIAVGITKTRQLAKQASGDAALRCMVNDEPSNEDSGKAASFEYRDLRKLANSESTKSSEKQKLSRKGAKEIQPLKAVESIDVAVESPEMAKGLSKSLRSSHPESSSPRMLDLETGTEGHTFRLSQTILPDSQGYDFEFSQKNISDSQGYDIQCGQREPGSQQHPLQVSQIYMPAETSKGQVENKAVKDRAAEGEKRRSRKVSKLIAERETSLQGTEVGSVVPNAASGEVSEKDSGDRVFEVESSLVSGEVREPLIFQENNNMVSKERDAKKRRLKALQALVKSTEEAQNRGEVQQNLKDNDPSLADQTLLQGQRTGEEDNAKEPKVGEDEEVGPKYSSPIQDEQTLPRMRGQGSSAKKKKRDRQTALSKVLKAPESTQDVASLSKEQMPGASTDGKETQPSSLSAKSKLKMKKWHSNLNTVVEQAKLDAVEEVKELEIPGDVEGDRHNGLTTESIVQNEHIPSMGEERIPSATRQRTEAESESLIEKIKLKMKRRRPKVDTPLVLEQTEPDVIQNIQQLDVPKQTAEKKHPLMGLTTVLKVHSEATDKKKLRKKNLSLSAVSGDAKRQGREVQIAETTGHDARQTEQEDQEATAPRSPEKVAETIVKHSNLKRRATKSANDKREDGIKHDGEDDDTSDKELETTMQQSNLKKMAKKSAKDKKEDGTKHDGEDDDTFDNEVETTMQQSNLKRRAKKSVKDKKEDGYKRDGEDDDVIDNEPETTVQQNELKKRAKKSVKDKEEDGPEQDGEDDDMFDNERETTVRPSNLKKRSKKSVKDMKEDGPKHDGEDDDTFDSEAETTIKQSNLKKRAKKSVKDKKEDGPQHHGKDDDTFVIEPVKLRKRKQGATKEVKAKSDASVGLQQVDAISRVACPHGCGKQYSSKTSAYYMHVKKCDMV